LTKRQAKVYFGEIKMDKKKIMNWVIAIIIAIGYLTISIVFDAWTYSWIVWVIYAVYRFFAK
jgi:hypothetical protein